jgi:RNA polymerase sigma-70 factor (ECF subfamily)
MTPESDRLLIQQIRTATGAAREAAWTELVERYSGRVRAYIRRRLMDSALTDDAVQETFIGFTTSLPNYDDKKDLQTWLFSIASYKVIDQLRKKGRQPFLADSDGPEDPLAQANDDRQRRASSLYRSKEQRNQETEALTRVLRQYLGELQVAKDYPRLQVLELLFVKGWKNQRVAAVLGVPDQTVANYKFQAVKRLAAAVKAAKVPDDAFPELDDANNPDPSAK